MLAGLILWYSSDVYDEILRWRLYAAAAVLFGLPITVYLIHLWRNDAIMQLWAILAFVLLVGISGRSVAEAYQFNYKNCWTLRERKTSDGSVSILQCAPDNEPPQGSGSNPYTESGSSHYCDQLSETATGVTTWRCTYSEF